MVDRTDLGDIPGGLVCKRLLSRMMELLHVPYLKHLMCRKEDAYSHCAVWEFTVCIYRLLIQCADASVHAFKKATLRGDL